MSLTTSLADLSVLLVEPSDPELTRELALAGVGAH